jgi:tetratricopeptide (TPR) repeat protein
MNLGSEYLIYLAAYRLAITTAGIVSIILGYKLFTHSPAITQLPNSSVEAKISNLKVALKNAAPGTGFALFGVILITAMLIQGSPQFTLEALNKAGQLTNPENRDQQPVKITMRDPGTTEFEAAINKGRSFEQAGDLSKAAGAYQDALAGLAFPMNELAAIYTKQGKLDDALPLGRLAVQIAPTDADVLDTFAETLAKHGDKAEAITWMNRAASLDDRYREKAAAFMARMK